MAMAMTIIADVVSPRERGRYQGYFGATFALSSIAGPLLGGVFTEHLSWRWIFYINLPIGIVALVVTSAVLKLPFRRQSHRIDFLGAGLMMVGVTAALLVTVWGGDPVPLGLADDHRAWAWCRPPSSAPSSCGSTTRPSRSCRRRLFRIGVFRTASTVSFLLSMVMFGAIIYLPLYLQLVDGVSPTVSGLLDGPADAGPAGLVDRRPARSSPAPGSTSRCPSSGRSW